MNFLIVFCGLRGPIHECLWGLCPRDPANRMQVLVVDIGLKVGVVSRFGSTAKSRRAACFQDQSTTQQTFHHTITMGHPNMHPPFTSPNYHPKPKNPKPLNRVCGRSSTGGFTIPPHDSTQKMPSEGVACLALLTLGLHKV